MKQTNNILKSRLGFTLLELLVVISIIGILLALGVVAFATAQQKGRDAKRRGDIKALQDGFEQYYAANNGSYGSCDAMRGDSDFFPGGAPTDPKTDASYECTVDSGDYCVCAELETANGNADSNPCPGSGLPSVVQADIDGELEGDDFYCLSNLQ